MSIRKFIFDFEELLQQRNQREVWLLFATIVALLFFISHKLFTPTLEARLTQTKQDRAPFDIYQNLSSQKANLASVSLQAASLQEQLSSLIKQKTIVENQLKCKDMMHLDSRNNSAFLDFVGTQIVKNSATLISIKPQQIMESISVPNRAGFIIECNAGFKNLLYILNEIENSPFVTTIDSVHIYANGKNIFKISLYGLGR